MSWYYFKCQHGPGHQSFSEKYEWLSEEEYGKLDEKLLRELWENWASEERWEYASGRVDKIDLLPENIKQEKILEYKYQIEDSKNMLKIIINSDPELYQKILDIDIKTLEALNKLKQNA